jgi:hypothetical protein
VNRRASALREACALVASNRYGVDLPPANRIEGVTDAELLVATAGAITDGMNEFRVEHISRNTARSLRGRLLTPIAELESLYAALDDRAAGITPTTDQAA